MKRYKEFADIERDLDAMLQQGQAIKHSDGTYQLTEAGKTFYRSIQRNPFKLPGDVDSLLIPMDLFEVLYLLCESMIVEGKSLDQCLVSHALACDISMGRILQLRGTLDKFLTKLNATQSRLDLEVM